MPDQIPGHLPESLHPFFWDVDARRLNPSHRSAYIIQRLLENGDLEAVRWVLHTYPKTEIIKTLKTRRGFSPRTATFWARYFDLPIEEFKCMQEPYRSQQRQLWPY
jgi:hypothetical protein